jgi:hypothetical protein
MDVCLVKAVCVLSGRGIGDELITRPEKSYRLCSVVVCDLETSGTRRPWPTGGSCPQNKQTNMYFYVLRSVHHGSSCE